MEYNFVDLEVKINKAIVEISSLIFEKEKLKLKEANTFIKKSLIGGKDNFIDYRDNKFINISNLLSKFLAGESEDFVFLFLSMTFLLESVLRIDENDKMKKDKLTDILSDLYRNFC